jgi:O-antigen/teichoic acid export membrane protein
MTPPLPVEGRTVSEVAELLAQEQQLGEPAVRSALGRTATGIVASSLVSASLGVVFWAVAARLFDASVVGVDSALIASLGTLSSICQLNFNNAIIRFLPQISRHLGRRILQAYAIAGGLSLVAGLLFVLMAPLASDEYDFLTAQPFVSVSFVVAIGAWTVFVLQDAVLTALGKASWMPIENGLFAAMKLLLLPLALLIGADQHAVFYAWIIPMFLVVPSINLLMSRRVIPRAAAAQANSGGVIGAFGRRGLAKFLAQDLVGTVLIQLAAAALPLLVVAFLGAEQNAYFYMPFTLVTTLDMMFQAGASSLTTEGARSPERIAEMTKAVIRRTATLQIPATIGLIVLAPYVLLPFGQDYSDQGTTLLRLLAAASCLRSIQWMFAATARLQGHGGRLLAYQAGSSCATVALVVIFAPSHGLNGFGVAWIIANGVTALLVLPSLVRFARNPRVLARPRNQPINR